MRRIAIATLCAAVGAASIRTSSAQPVGDAPGDPAPVLDDGPDPTEALTQRIAVWRLDALGIEAELVTRLETLFRSELDRLAKHPLPTRREMDAAVGKDRKLRECTGEDKCLTAIGAKVGVDIVVTAEEPLIGQPLRGFDGHDPMRGDYRRAVVDVDVRQARIDAGKVDRQDVVVADLAEVIGMNLGVRALPTRNHLPGKFLVEDQGRERIRQAW